MVKMYRLKIELSKDPTIARSGEVILSILYVILYVYDSTLHKVGDEVWCIAGSGQKWGEV